MHAGKHSWHKISDDLWLLNHPASRVLCVLVHGVNVADGREFWGRIPGFLAHDVPKCIDVLVPTFLTKFTLFDRLISLLKRAPRLANSEMIASSLAPELSEMVNPLSALRYERILIVGHSYGGLIALCTAHEMQAQIKDMRVYALCMCASPLQPQKLARIVHALNLGHNDQLRDLGSWRALARTCGGMFETVRRHTKTWYLHAINDEVLDDIPHPSSLSFHKTAHHSGRHSWPSDVKNRKSSGYKNLLNFVKVHVS